MSPCASLAAEVFLFQKRPRCPLGELSSDPKAPRGAAPGEHGVLHPAELPVPAAAITALRCREVWEQQGWRWEPIAAEQEGFAAVQAEPAAVPGLLCQASSSCGAAEPPRAVRMLLQLSPFLPQTTRDGPTMGERSPFRARAAAKNALRSPTWVCTAPSLRAHPLQPPSKPPFPSMPPQPSLGVPMVSNL